MSCLATINTSGRRLLFFDKPRDLFQIPRPQFAAPAKLQAMFL
jgi:hypothetical protein